MKYLATLLLMLVLTPAMPRAGAGAPAPEYLGGVAIPVLDEQWVSVPKAVLSLAGAWPNPSPGAVLVRFSLPSGDRATLGLFDLRGRLVAEREVGELGAGAHGVALAGLGDLAAGVYLIRLVRGEQILTAKACVVR